MVNNQNLLAMREKKVITTPEYMVIFNCFFKNIHNFKNTTGLSYTKLRQLYLSGINKIIKYKKNEKNIIAY